LGYHPEPFTAVKPRAWIGRAASAVQAEMPGANQKSQNRKSKIAKMKKVDTK